MSSFEGKITHFLNSAVQQQVIEQPVANDLISFAKSGKYEQGGWFSLSRSLGGLGAFVLCFGVILIIASNWNLLSNLTKISMFIVLLGSCHFTGLYLAKKNYKNSAIFLHLLGAGLVIAGIGLVAQIFNLNSNPKNALGLWLIMIAPLAIILKNGPIALLSLIIFTVWGNFQIDSLMEICLFDISVSISMVLGGKLLKQKNSDMGSFIEVPGVIFLMSWLYVLGFTHHYTQTHLINLLFPLFTLIPAIIIGWYLWSKDHNNKEERHFLIAIACAILTIVIAFFISKIASDQHNFFEISNFGSERKIYILPLIISISAWISYFGLSIWGVIYGALNHRRTLLNASVFALGIEIFTRFIDLISGMMNTGGMFIICGISLVAIGFILEKWRKNLIQAASI